MKFLKFTFTAAIAAMALWSCEKAETEIDPVPSQEEFTVAQKSAVNVVDEMSYATRTIDSLLYNQIVTVCEAVKAIVAAPDNIFPSVNVKDCIVNLLSSVIPQDTTISRILPFVYSNVDNTFGIMNNLLMQLELSTDEETGLHEVTPATSEMCIAHFVTSSGDTYYIALADAKRSEYKGFRENRGHIYGFYVEKNGDTVFEIDAEDEKEKFPSMFLESGLEYRHTHNGILTISAIEMFLNYDVDFTAGNMKYDFAMSMPMFADADTLLKVTGEFQQKGYGLAHTIESNQWFSMMDKGININVESSDLKKMVGLIARALLKDESGYSEEFCGKLSDEWGTTASITVYSGVAESGYIYLGYLPVNEDNPGPELFVPEFLVHIYEYFGEEFTIPEFIEMMKPMLPSIPLPF